MSKNPRITTKERNLLKGSWRRIFSRSELRRRVLDRAIVKHLEPTRPRVTKWVICAVCNKPNPAYLCVVDHVQPLIPLDKSLEDMSWDEVLDRLWCVEENLQVICPDDHRVKSLAENKERRRIKKEKGTKK